ncbi:GRIM-19 [Mrakia frigida]|uniref:GRIM-19 n=1 Tax=Mrakia frigida TaxID=29902 RepID=UPI003FCC0BBD
MSLSPSTHSGSLPSIPYKQDMPPPQGYGSVRYKRSLPFKGISGLLVFATAGFLTTLGHHYGKKSRAETRENQRENSWARIHMIPFLMAENERDQYRREWALKERERIIMKDVEGWEVGKMPYHTKDYVRPKVWLH